MSWITPSEQLGNVIPEFRHIERLGKLAHPVLDAHSIQVGMTGDNGLNV